MARQQKNQQGSKKEAEKVEVLSSAPVESLPEDAGTMTDAAADAAPREPEHKGPSKAMLQAQEQEAEREAKRLADEKAVADEKARAARAAAEKAIADAAAAGKDDDAVKQAAEKAAADAIESVPDAPVVQDPDSLVEYYRVLNDRFISGNGGFRAKLRAGKEVSSRNYNIRTLRRQGVQLERIDAPKLYE